jgi:hypothetical protein
MNAPKAPVQLHITPTLIGVPLAWTDDGDVAPEGLLVAGVVEALWLLEEHAPKPRATARVPAIQGHRRGLEDLARSLLHTGRLVAMLFSFLIGDFLPGQALTGAISSGHVSSVTACPVRNPW